MICISCDGWGEVQCWKCEGHGSLEGVCETCNGSSVLGCERCDGAGNVTDAIEEYGEGLVHAEFVFVKQKYVPHS